MISIIKKAAFLAACSLCALPVVAQTNDITLKNVTPKAGELDTELRSLEQITLTFTADVNVHPNTLAYLTTPDGKEMTAPLERNQYLKNTVLLSFPDITYYAGNYTLTIKKWSVGDDKWFKDYELGHSNPEIKIEWTVTNGLSMDVDYDLQPVSILPANGASFTYPDKPLSTIQITMPAGTLLNPQMQAEISCTEARYSRTLAFEAEDRGSSIVFTADVSPTPALHGNYLMNIPGGLFCDGEFLASGKGHANPPISYMYAVDLSDPDASGDEETVDWTLTPSGVSISNSGSSYIMTWTLPAGTLVDKSALSRWRILDPKGYRVAGASFSLADDADPGKGVKFEALLTPGVDYVLVMAEATCRNQEYDDSNHLTGMANATLRYGFSAADISSGIHTAAADAAAPRTVYTAQGIRLHDDATDAQLRALAPGLYIIAGKKVIVK